MTQIYMTSPDWIKALLVVLPFLTLYATARLFRRPEVVPAPAQQARSVLLDMPAAAAPSPLAIPLATASTLDDSPGEDCLTDDPARQGASP